MFKKIFYSAALFCVALGANATILTVSNFGGSPAMYSSLTAAVDAATIDDTLLIHASATPYTFDNYSGFNKRLTVIGSGWNGIGTKIRGTLDGCCGNRVTFNTGAEGSIYRGIEFVSVTDIGASQLIFDYCRFNPESEYAAAVRTNVAAGCGSCGGSEYNAQDLVFQNCYFNNFLDYINNDTNLLFQNCIFQAISGSSNNAAAIRIGGNENLAPVNPIVFDHNIFLSQVHIDFSSAVFNNNIFAELASAATSSGNGPNTIGNGNFCHNCQFNNNLTYCTSCALSTITGATFSNNLENQPMPFVNLNNNFTLADFNLIDSSTGNNYAIDGTDVGVHGGASPYIAESNYGSTLLEMPVVNTFTLFNNILQQGDNLQFNATSTIPVQE